MMLFRGASGGLARLMQAECWNFMAAIYVSGIDGWSDGQA